jgi:hypothetical protein
LDRVLRCIKGDAHERINSDGRITSSKSVEYVLVSVHQADVPSRSHTMTDDLAFAWAAGLFEGEGTVTYSPRTEGRKMSRRVAIGMTDPDVLRRFHEVVGVGHLNGPYHRRSTKTGKPIRSVWTWTCGRWTELEPLLERLEPFLGQRRGAAVRKVLADSL